jgi:hypothetical protein
MFRPHWTNIWPLQSSIRRNLGVAPNRHQTETRAVAVLARTRVAVGQAVTEEVLYGLAEPNSMESSNRKSDTIMIFADMCLQRRCLSVVPHRGVKVQVDRFTYPVIFNERRTGRWYFKYI